MHRPVEMLEVDARFVRRHRHASCARELRAHRVFVERPGVARIAGAQAIPEMMERDGTGFESETAERMHERLAGAAPAIELDGQLDRSVGGLENVEGAESQRIEVTANGGDGGLSDSDRAHGRGFDQRDRDAEAAQSLRERGGRHPARGAATDDEHGTNGSGARVLHGAMVARRRLALVTAAREYVCKP